MKRGFEHKLLPPYKVTKPDKPQIELPLQNFSGDDEQAEGLLDGRYQKVESRTSSPLPETGVSDADATWGHSKNLLAREQDLPV